jgi:chromosome partition protein MukB
VKRTVAMQLALVNWRGVFYERYVLDPGVTALEGANGAGKTTVMIAAYVVLLPDQRFLHFEPLAEEGARAEDRGVWGRLGEGGDSYAAIDFRLGNGERLVAGVHLARTGRDGGELHPFLVRGLPADVQLQQMLLERRDGHDEVPAPDRLADLAAVSGARLEWSDSVNAYLQNLFDAGVTPMPLSTDSERAKLNELLRTSMLGGISRRLGEGLRAFLLRPEEGLGDTLTRIRGSLDDCRRTRMQVDESRRLEQEIHDVLDAGVHMFAAAVEGTRRFADERQRQAADALRKENDAKVAHDEFLSRHADAQTALMGAEGDEAEAKSAAADAEEWSRQVGRANEIWRKRTEEEARRQAHEETAADAASVHGFARAALQSCEETVRVHEKDHQESAKGMADIQAGLERLHSRASRYRAVRAALRRARGLLSEIEFADRDAGLVLDRCEREASEASARLVAARARLDTAEQAEHAFRQVHGALSRIAERSLADLEAHAVALKVLSDLRAEDTAVERLPSVRAEKEKAAVLALRQEAARKKALALTSDEEPVSTTADVQVARSRCSDEVMLVLAELASAVEKHGNLLRDITSRKAEFDVLVKRADDSRRLKAAVHSVATRWGRAIEGSRDLTDLFSWLQENLARTQQSTKESEAKVAATEGALQELRNARGSFPRHLAEACETVDGRLLVERFEEVPFDQAAEVEARLGPLVHAILVTDPELAARRLAEVDARPETVWLVDGQRSELTPGKLPDGDRHRDAVAVPQTESVRLTRLPGTPVVGRQARERVVHRLELELRAAEAELADDRERVRLLRPDIEVTAGLFPKAELLDGPDPEPLVTTASDALLETERSATSAAKKVDVIRRHAEQLNARKSALEDLWFDADLLDSPDQAKRVIELEADVVAAVGAQRHLDTVRRDREALEQRLDVLRAPPPDEATRAELRRIVESAQEGRQRWIAPQPDLESARDDIEALQFADAEETIRKDEQLLASLNTQVEAAERRLDETRGLRDAAKEEESKRDLERRSADSALDACRNRIHDLEEELMQTAVKDASDTAAEYARTAAGQAAAIQEKASMTTRRAAELVAGLAPQVAAALERLTMAVSDREEKDAQAGPAVVRWNALRDRCQSLGLLDAALADASLEEVEGKASIDVFQLRRRWWDLMLDRLDHAADGKGLAESLRLIGAADEAGGEQFLRAWLDARSWLAQRVPKHVSEVNDPVEALRRLRRHLDALMDKLGRYEARLRGDSRDVVRSIEGRLRKVNNLLVKLNRDLGGVGFGSIEAIRVQSERETKMSGILTALSAPENQQQLFAAEMTIEEALDELFRRHGGRRDGGRRILDYREYVRLRVEVRRRGSETWEEARGNQLSTGEAIGVGAAIMMVVLTAWERDASLLRARREVGTLRFLFLDEATRLSLDNLEVLFGLCAALELQLLIAAPEVATSSGNTTYLLQRSVDSAGREAVVVSGRRAIRGGA